MPDVIGTNYLVASDLSGVVVIQSFTIGCNYNNRDLGKTTVAALWERRILQNCRRLTL